jgi:hypothetical protein
MPALDPLDDGRAGICGSWRLERDAELQCSPRSPPGETNDADRQQRVRPRPMGAPSRRRLERATRPARRAKPRSGPDRGRLTLDPARRPRDPRAVRARSPFRPRSAAPRPGHAPQVSTTRSWNDRRAADRDDAAGRVLDVPPRQSIVNPASSGPLGKPRFQQTSQAWPFRGRRIVAAVPEVELPCPASAASRRPRSPPRSPDRTASVGLDVDREGDPPEGAPGRAWTFASVGELVQPKLP